MKFLKLMIASVAVMAMCLNSPAAVDPLTTFAGAGTTGTTLSYAVVSANGSGVPRVQYVNATSDKAASVIQFYKVSSSIPISATGASGQAVVTAVGTGFSGSDVCVVRHVSADTYERLAVSAATATNITFTANLAAAVAAGDVVYKMATNGSIPCGATTKEVNATSSGLYNGTSSQPILIDLDGTSACKINVVAGAFQR